MNNKDVRILRSGQDRVIRFFQDTPFRLHQDTPIRKDLAQMCVQKNRVQRPGGIMKPRDYIIAQINHIETNPVPYVIGYEEDIGTRLDQYYGNVQWRDKIRPYDTPTENAAAVIEAFTNQV